jgi:L-lactate dehydrogenase complex protein LldG
VADRSAREEILRALRAVAPPDPGPPEGEPVAARYADLPGQLAEAVQAVGGTLIRVDGPAALEAEVRALAERLQAARIVSEVPAAGPGNVRLASYTDPHEMEGIDLAVIPGVFAVAETGAVWVDGAALAHRGVFVITQHLALVVAAGAIVNDMHEAYGRLRFAGPGFGLFVAGPSKTADIEQALVIGAHGARSATVFLVG